LRDWRVLACLGGFGPLTNTEISRVVGMDAATITRSVQFLQESGLVMTRASRSDKRKQVISLTVAGGVAHDEIAPVRRAAAAKVERLLSQKDRKELYRILDRLDEALSALNEEGDPEDVWDEPDARAQVTRGSRRD
jgi:DNA-binding MarR family transcriptional regulator